MKVTLTGLKKELRIMKKRIIPFGWLPAAWGLRGSTRKKAELEYYFEGEELEYHLLELELDEHKRKLDKLHLDKKYHKISDNDYDKELATLTGVPWVKILTTEYDQAEPLTGSLELDWNEHFIASLEEAGYAAPSEEEMVDLWLSELCKNIATEQFGGVGEFDEKAEEVLEQKKKRTLDNGRYEKS